MVGDVVKDIGHRLGRVLRRQREPRSHGDLRRPMDQEFWLAAGALLRDPSPVVHRRVGVVSVDGASSERTAADPGQPWPMANLASPASDVDQLTLTLTFAQVIPGRQPRKTVGGCSPQLHGTVSRSVHGVAPAGSMVSREPVIEVPQHTNGMSNRVNNDVPTEAEQVRSNPRLKPTLGAPARPGPAACGCRCRQHTGGAGRGLPSLNDIVWF